MIAAACVEKNIYVYCVEMEALGLSEKRGRDDKVLSVFRRGARGTCLCRAACVGREYGLTRLCY